MKTAYLAFCSLFLVLLLSSCENYTWIPTQGTVTGKTKERRSGKPVWFVQVNYFTQPEKERADTAPKAESNKPRTPDEIINSLNVGDVEFGNYYTAQIKVSSGVYDSYVEGDSIDLEYAKEKPEEIRIRQ